MILLLDFTCARRESHSWDSLLRFQKFLNSASPEHVTICIPRAELFPAHDSSSTFSLGLRVFEKQLSGESHRLNLREFLVSTFKILLSTRRVIKKFSPNKLVWPNTEGPSLLVGLILSILERNRNFYFRFIGWPEFWTPFRFLLLKLLIKAARFRKNVFLSFETQALMNFLNGHGIVVPYPIHLPESLKTQESRRVLLMGSARKEKGFESMYQFANELAKALPEFELVLQESINSWDGYKEILQNLRSLPNVSLLPAFIDRHELNGIVMSCKFTILPYDVNVYRIRGSAALFESIEQGKPVIVLQDCSFSSDVVYFNLGQVAKDVQDMVRCIRSLNSTRNVKWGFDVFSKYSEEQIKSWLL